MSTLPPLVFRWDGEALQPLHPRVADRHLTIGEAYCFVEHHDRSAASHRHYFAAIAEAWKNLPELYAGQFPTSEHLRKYALIKAGYRDERSYVAASKADAVRLASFVKPMDDFAVVVATEAVVTSYTAKSQSLKAMGKRDFQASKEAVLGILGDMIGTDAASLLDAAHREAA